jgi:[ribosomal protein S18]-alanine N-acetyltransferase
MPGRRRPAFCRGADLAWYRTSAPITWLARLLGRAAPAISPSGSEDASLFAALHAVAFGRGWSADEFERLLIDPNVVADRAMAGSRLAGFVLSRLAADEAEILSIAVAPAYRTRGLARKLLDVHLRRLFAYGITALFLEVDERNVPARRLYAGLRFVAVGRRDSYFAQAGRDPGAALVLRRDLP